MGELATRDETAVATVQEYGAGLMDVIARAARDPSVDIDKMERLIAMQERVQARQSKEAYYAALSLMQPEIPSIGERGAIKGRNDAVQSTYALWEDINDIVKPILAKHGFALAFKCGKVAEGVTVTGVLSHAQGHWEETTLTLPNDASGSKNAVQAVGSSISYGKRYTASLLLNITSHGEDDDGAATGRQMDRLDREIAKPMQGKSNWPDGPTPNKTQAMAAIRKMKDEGNQITDPDHFNAHIKSYQSIIDQFEAAHHSWWLGVDAEGNDFESIPAWVERRRDEFASAYFNSEERK